MEGNDVSICCEINQINIVGIWYKNGSPVSSTDRIECGKNEKMHILKIHNAELSDSAVYCIDFKGVKRQIQLHVEDYFSKALSIDPRGPIEGNDISISCEIKQKNVSGKWYQNERLVATTEKMEYDLEVKVLPEAINQLSEEDKIRYYKLMQSSQTENRYFVRVMIVGKGYAGKTCLLRRLMKENISNVSSTDGIDIVVRRCKINVENGKWTIEKEIHDDIVARINRALVTNAKGSDTQNMQVRGTKNRNVSHCDEMSTYKKDLTTDTAVNLDKNEDKNETSSLVMAEYFTTAAKVNLDKNNDEKESSSLVIPEDLMSHVFSKSTVNTHSNL
ncbi:OBSCN [Mytilus coruscus]|uniref:OBSCN n=1 Tax=Mytilus coruscus TaxID=42192 RepID=A0A6J8C1W9_MYTCO|nr:OBSCN [Mytilus coruscus]